MLTAIAPTAKRQKRKRLAIAIDDTAPGDTKKNYTKGLLFNGLPPNHHHAWLTDSDCAATGTVLSTEVKSLHALICLQEELLQEQKLQIQEKNK